MSSITLKKFGRADEVRPFQAHGRIELVKFGELSIGRGVFEPGWRWTADVGPIAKTRSCEAAHTGVCLTGRMRVTMDNGETQEIGPGDAFTIPPGHDAEVLGSETCVLLDFTGFASYALPAGQRPSIEQRELRPH